MFDGVPASATSGSSNSALVPAPRRTVHVDPPTPEEWQAFTSLIDRFPHLLPGMDPRNRITVQEVCDSFLEDQKTEIAAETWESRRYHLRRFCRQFGKRLVKDLTPMDLKAWINSLKSAMPSDYTRRGVRVSIGRCFNWAYEARIIKSPVFHGLRMRFNLIHGRDIKPHEFQAVLRHADKYLGRFLLALKFTGCRPCELRNLKWSDIDWQRGIATLKHHKTFHSTGKPRVIYLIPQLLKMLVWIKRSQHGPAASELRYMLQSAPNRTMRAKEVAQRMKSFGFTYRRIYRARHAIGAVYERVGGWREHGYTVYRLPEHAEEARPPVKDFVFTCSKLRPWKRYALCLAFRRIKKKLKLPKCCRMYGCRHAFITKALKRGVNMQAIADLVGHTGIVLISKIYSHVSQDIPFMRASAEAAVALSAIPIPATPEPEEPLPCKYPRAKPTPPPKVKPAKGTFINPADQFAYDAYQVAVKAGIDKDGKAFEWLRAPEFAKEVAAVSGFVPPSIEPQQGIFTAVAANAISAVNL